MATTSPLDPFDFEPELQEAFLSHAIARSFAADELILEVGTPVGSLPLLTTGAVRILREDGEGGELLLYFLEAGETCAATLTCCLERGRSQVRAVAEVETQILFAPLARVEDWMARYPSWRRFVMRSYSERFDELLGAVDAIAFGSLTERMTHLLEQKAIFHDSRTISATHRELAEELHSSRVVVSRVLKSLEREGRLRIGRNEIELLG